MFGKLFYVYIASFLLGILVHSIFLDAYLGNTILFFILGICTLVYFFGNTSFRILSLSTVIFLVGFLYFGTAIDTEKKQILHYFAKQEIEIILQGVIDEKPLQLDSSQTLVVDVDYLILGKNREPIDTRLLLRTYDYQTYSYGQTIEFGVIPQIPESFEADGGRMFDYEHFLEKDGIYYTGKSYDVHILKSARRSIFSALYIFKDKLLTNIYRYIPKPESSLLAGVLLGEKTALGDELEDDFRTTGLMHIVVLSGYNVSLVIMAVMIVLGFLPLYTRSIIAVFGIVAFALLVGAGPTVIRASIMALFIVLARVVGRPYNVERALILAGLCMVIYNPWVLFYDISFQFSFLATYGLIVLMPLLEEKLSFIPKAFLLRESAAATLSAQIMVAPLILYYIGDFSTVAIFVNMLVLFMVPVTMFLGFITLMFAFVVPHLASIIAIPATYSLKYILVLVDVFAGIPFAKFTIHKFSFIWIVLYYIFIFYWVFRRQRKEAESFE